LFPSSVIFANTLPDREEAKREENFDFANEYEEEEDEEWEQEADWSNEADETEDVKDESAAYLEFLNEEVCCYASCYASTRTNKAQAQKFSSVEEDDDDDELEEESLLETPLDKVEPYSMFKHALLRKYHRTLFLFHVLMEPGLQQEQPALYENLTKNLNPEEQQIVQGAVHQADVIAEAQVQAQQAAANGIVAPPQQ
jgi:hypothetical protein